MEMCAICVIGHMETTKQIYKFGIRCGQIDVLSPVIEVHITMCIVY